jgi:hypothetical protein
MNSNKCKHGFQTDPNGYHIFPKTDNKNKKDIWKEAERLYNKEFPKTEQQPIPINENQIKKFATLLEDVSKY